MPRERDHVESRSGDAFLERIPSDVYADLVNTLSQRYEFPREGDGVPLRCAEYFLGLRRSAADDFLKCVRRMLQDAQDGTYPELPLPEGFHPPADHLPAFDRRGGVPFGYFDAAVTAEGLRIIEVQSNVTYSLTAAFAGDFLGRSLDLSGSSPFVDHSASAWEDFLDCRREIIAGDAVDGIVVADRELARQKTRFEHKATQREFPGTMAVVDTREIFENDGRLYFKSRGNGAEPQPIRRLYHRTLALEAIEEDDYPRDAGLWRFRFDRPYEDLIHVNHPGTNFRLSKHILPYVSHPLNPPCYELSEVAESFRRGEIAMDDYVWKHKLGVAGRGLYRLPDAEVLAESTAEGRLDEYIAQRKVEFESFRTSDGGEKIVELRFMSTQTEDRLFVVPMARIGHVRSSADGRRSFHIHFGENDRPGYGFCPVLVVDD